MGKINLLSSDISNKIAAGEVVERPVSVVKELVENSIDAGSTKITVEIKFGGSVLIRVTDNGCGMEAEDAEIAFLRHATSKIKAENDLDAIYTLGFRGEALSSIGAVAQVQLFTKQKESEFGIQVCCDGGEIIASDESGIADGTTFIVENLFYNTPARKKFLKKDATEFAYISDMMTRMIVSHPDISFKLINNGKTVLMSPGDGNLLNAIYVVYGRDYVKSMLLVDYTQDAIHVTGAIGKNTLMRPNRSFENFFVNGRYIKSPLMIKAIEEAYKNQMMIGKFPVCVMNIDINPTLIDINVHPTKLEAKFSDEKSIYESVYYATKNALYATVNIPKIEKSADNSFHNPKPHAEIEKKNESTPNVANIKKDTNNNKVSDKTILNREASQTSKIEPITKKSDTLQNTAIKDNSEIKKEPENGAVQTSIDTKNEKPAYSDPLAQFRIQNNDTTTLHEPQVSIKSTISENTSKPSETKDITHDPSETKEITFDNIKLLGQVFDTYIIAEFDNEMLLIDQHAAHERLKYEQLLNETDENSAVYSQMLIEGVLAKLSGKEMAIFERNTELLDRLGFNAEVFGDNTVIIRSSPTEVSNSDIDDLFIELLNEIEDDKQKLQTKKHERLLYTIACKSAVKANHSLSTMEMNSLVKGVLSLDKINTCPHGRPIIIKMTKKEIEKQFKRIV